MRIKYLFIFSVVICLSCTKRLGTNNSIDHETINGFDVSWSGNISEEQKTIITDILNDMVPVQGGRFLMGATAEQQACPMVRNNEYPVHMVELDDFYICRHEMTYDQLKAFCSRTFMIWLEWQEAIDILNMIRDFTSLDIDLPTEAQWEYAARGGRLSKGYTYPGSNSLSDVWNENGEILSTVPNELGIYNLGDGLYEWCKDYYYQYKDSGLEINPYHCQNTRLHVLRGNGTDPADFSKYDLDSYGKASSSSHISSRSIQSGRDNATLRLVINR